MKKLFLITAILVLLLLIMFGCTSNPNPNTNPPAGFGTEAEHYCTVEEKNNNVCTKDYNPVCGKYVLNTGAVMYQTFGNACTACAEMKVMSFVPGECGAQLVGNDVDEHGCIPSAGYSWCEAKQKCLRVWEEGCDSNFVACTAEALICPDGNAVGRSGPNCEFNSCPNCSCPAGYMLVGSTCNPECYYSTPACLSPSIECTQTGQ